MTERACKWCGDTFTVSRTRRNYCSEVCRSAVKNNRVRPGEEVRYQINCHRCGSGFVAVFPHAKFCTLACKRKHRNQVRQAAAAKLAKRCVSCGVAYETTDSRRRCCSKKCRRNMANRLKTIRRQNLRLVTVACVSCGNDFSKTDTRKRFCSTDCRIAARRKRTKGYEAARYIREMQAAVTVAITSVPEVIPAYKVLQNPDAKGVGFSGYSERAPRQAVTTVTGCPTCRASGKDYRGNIHHASWCEEAA